MFDHVTSASPTAGFGALRHDRPERPRQVARPRWALHREEERELGQIDHLWLRVADVAAATRFYETIAPPAGLEVRIHSPEHTQLVAAGSSFEVVNHHR